VVSFNRPGNAEVVGRTQAWFQQIVPAEYLESTSQGDMTEQRADTSEGSQLPTRNVEC